MIAPNKEVHIQISQTPKWEKKTASQGILFLVSNGQPTPAKVLLVQVRRDVEHTVLELTNYNPLNASFHFSPNEATTKSLLWHVPVFLEQLALLWTWTNTDKLSIDAHRVVAENPTSPACNRRTNANVITSVTNRRKSSQNRVKYSFLGLFLLKTCSLRWVPREWATNEFLYCSDKSAWRTNAAKPHISWCKVAVNSWFKRIYSHWNEILGRVEYDTNLGQVSLFLLQLSSPGGFHNYFLSSRLFFITILTGFCLL